MHEIVTLQFGQQSNYLGSHFWNAQESYFTYDDAENKSGAPAEPSPVDHDVHFRPGIGVDGSDTFMPRAVIYDLKGAFGSMRRINALYEPEQDDEQSALWSGTTTTHRLPAIPPSAYQQALDAGLQAPPLTKESVRYWSDYSRVYYHPKGLVQLHEYELQSQLMPFEGWEVGEELFAGLDKEHDLLDRDLRPFVEECDQLQGLQVLSSVDDAWGGFSAQYVERLRDEFGKLPIWVWGLEAEEKKARDAKLLQLTNHARSLHALSPSASAYIPVAASPKTLPTYLSAFDQTSRWHTSALQAAALESLTLPSRLRAGGVSLAQMEAVFNNGGNRRVAQVRMSVAEAGALGQALEEREEAARGPGGGEEQDEEEEGGWEDGGMDLSRLGPEAQMLRQERSSAGGRKTQKLFGRVESLRGQWEADARIEAGNRKARERFGGGPLVQRYGSSSLFPVLDSYPRIFAFEGVQKPEKLAVRAALTTSSGISGRLRAMGGLVGRLVGIEEREELASGLKAMADEYEEGWDSGLEDSEDDDE